MGPLQQRSRATLGLHHASPGVRPLYGQSVDDEGGELDLARVSAAFRTEMRGVSRPGVTTTTTAVRGVMQEERLQRQFFTQLQGAGARSSGSEP
jgi:hypothetical protein